MSLSSLTLFVASSRLSASNGQTETQKTQSPQFSTFILSGKSSAGGAFASLMTVRINM